MVALIKRRLAQTSGQMSVELCVCLPVILMALVIVVDGLLYVSECARFDHAAAQAVLACGVTSPDEQLDQGALTSAVQQRLAEEFSASSEEVSVSTSQDWEATTYTCSLSVAPWPLSSGGLRVFSMRVPTALTHTYSFSVKPYATGALL